MGCNIKGRDEACQVLRSEDEQLNTAIFELEGVTNECWDGPLDGMYTINHIVLDINFKAYFN